MSVISTEGSMREEKSHEKELQNSCRFLVGGWLKLQSSKGSKCITSLRV